MVFFVCFLPFFLVRLFATHCIQLNIIDWLTSAFKTLTLYPPWRHFWGVFSFSELLPQMWVRFAKLSVKTHISSQFPPISLFLVLFREQQKERSAPDCWHSPKHDFVFPLAKDTCSSHSPLGPHYSLGEKAPNKGFTPQQISKVISIVLPWACNPSYGSECNIDAFITAHCNVWIIFWHAKFNLLFLCPYPNICFFLLHSEILVKTSLGRDV